MVHFYLHRFSQLNDSCFLKESDWLVYRIDWTFGIILYLWNNTNRLIVRIHTNKSAPFSHWLNITAEVALGPKSSGVALATNARAAALENSHVTNFRWNHRSYIHRGFTPGVVHLLGVVTWPAHVPLWPGHLQNFWAQGDFARSAKSMGEWCTFYSHRFSQLNDSCFLKESDWLVYRIDWTFGIIFYLWNNTNRLIERIHTNKSAPFSHWLNITAQVALGPKILEVPSPQTHVPLRWKIVTWPTSDETTVVTYTVVLPKILTDKVGKQVMWPNFCFTKQTKTG